MSRKIAENEYYVQKRRLKVKDIILVSRMKMGLLTLPPKMVHLKFFNLRKNVQFYGIFSQIEKYLAKRMR